MYCVEVVDCFFKAQKPYTQTMGGMLMKRRLTEVQRLSLLLALLVTSYGRAVFPQEAASWNTTSIASIALLVVVGGFLTWFLVRLIRRSAKKRPLKGSEPGVYVSTTPGTKPFGLVVVVLYTLIAGVLGVIAGVLAIAVGELVDALFLPVGVLFLAAGYGLWSTQRWGLNLARGIYLVAILLGVVTASISGISTTTDWLGVVEIAVEIAVTIYLFRPQAREFFE